MIREPLVQQARAETQRAVEIQTAGEAGGEEAVGLQEGTEENDEEVGGHECVSRDWSWCNRGVCFGWSSMVVLFVW